MEQVVIDFKFVIVRSVIHKIEMFDGHFYVAQLHDLRKSIGREWYEITYSSCSGMLPLKLTLLHKTRDEGVYLCRYGSQTKLLMVFWFPTQLRLL